VREDFRDFNFYSFQSFLKDHGMKVTLPDKSDNSSAFLHKDEVDFLKRKSKYIPEINTSIGALDENSIFKSLHSNLKSKGATREQVAASCIETAMHEWFAHGRDVYEKRQKQMQQVIKRVSLPVPAVDCTYDERVQFWLEKYADSS
jgi:HPt (histidine-containing phosphotransfer) domain-containing protein